MELLEKLQQQQVTIDPIKAKAELCKRYFYYFFCEFWETIEAVEFIPNWHIEYICDQLQAAYEAWERGESQPDILFNVPPGTSKTTITTQIFPAWLWVKNRSTRIITSSYSSTLATNHAVKTRDLLKSEKFNLYFPGLIKFKADTDGKTHYKNTEKGERFVTSTGGTVTGMHGDFIIIDDPINPEDAMSDPLLKTAIRYTSRTLSTRKTDKKRSVTIMVMQRLHENDPAGNWLKKKKNLKHICLPGRVSDKVKPAELKEKYINGLLDVNRLDEAALEKLKEDLGGYGYALQILQEEHPEEGGIWQRWFVAIPDRLCPIITDLKKYGSDWDLAYTKEESNSACAFVTAAQYKDGMYIDAIGWKWFEFPELMNYMKAQQDPHYIEQKASGKSAKQTLIKMGIPATEVPVVGGDKEARARLVTPFAQSGKIFVRESILDKLYDDEKQGIIAFPNGMNNDLEDALVQSINRLLYKKDRGWIV